MKKAKYQILNTFYLKIIAIITMTFDHVGVLLLQYKINETAIIGCRIIGRLSLPIIAILFAEAMRYTKDREHYMSRIGLMAMIVLIAEIIMTYAFKMSIGDNIFLTILASAAFVYFFEKKKLKYLCIIPITFILLSFAIDVQYSYTQGETFLPQYIKGQYSLFGFILMVGSYFMYRLTDNRVLTLTKDSRTIEELREYPYYRTFTNLMWIVLLIAVNVVFWIIGRAGGPDVYNYALQTYSILAFIPILLYNGEKGYKNKFLQYSFYAYYPIHLIILFMSFYLCLGAVW